MIAHTLSQAIQSTGVLRCLECGKCSAVCPLAQDDAGFAPRRTVEQALAHRDEEFLQRDQMWTCLTCLHCNQVCPANIDYAALTLAIREEAHRRGQAALCTHGQAIHIWMRRMTDPALKQNRLDWLPAGVSYELSDVRLDQKTPARRANSDTLLFTGCAPYYDALFAHLAVPGTRVLRSTVSVLNALQITPVLLSNERCCGHDLLWEGDLDRFLELARLNAEMLNATGVKRIISNCPECVRALKIDYPAHGIRLNATVLHLSELLAEAHLDISRQDSKRVTYHDPCRLGRHLGVYDPPRRVLEQLGYQILEMPHYGRNATCCGTNGWTHCDATNKSIQMQRLEEARATGAELMVTACLKCQVHFRCALMDPELKRDVGIEMVDLAELVAGTL